MKTATKITKPTRYRGFIIAPRAEGFDLINPDTGQWAHFDTQRFAKWSSSFLTNLNDRFSANPSLPTQRIPKAEV